MKKLRNVDWPGKPRVSIKGYENVVGVKLGHDPRLGKGFALIVLPFTFGAVTISEENLVYLQENKSLVENK